MAGTDIMLFQKSADVITFTDKFAMCAAATMGCNPEQGRSIAMSMWASGLTAQDYKRRYHWIPGKGESMRADAMRSEFRSNHGGTYKILETSPKKCTIYWKDKDGQEYTDTYTRTDMLLSRWPWGKVPGWQKCTATVRSMLASGKTEDEIWMAMLPNFKDNWGTELDWQTMLLARRTSSSLTYVCPELVAGVVTPEELQDMDVDAIEGTILPPKPVPKTASEMLATAQPQTATTYTEVPVESLAEDGEIVEAEYTMTTEESQVDPAVEESPFDGSIPEEPELTAKQCKLIESIVDKFKIAFEGEESDKQFAAALSKRGVNSLAQLDETSLQDMEDKLAAYIAKQSKN